MAATLSILVLLFLTMNHAPAQISIIDTGSTNAPGMTIKLQNAGPHATVEPRNGAKQPLQLDRQLCARLMEDLQAAGPLNELPVRHCMKSVSFGKSLFVEYNGVRSPDLSCPQSDAHALALQKDATEILAAARIHAKSTRPM